MSKREQFWGVEFWHSLGWTPCSRLMLTRKEARKERRLWIARGMKYRYRVAKYIRAHSANGDA